MRIGSACLTWLLVLSGTCPALAGTPLGDTRSTLEKWVETRQLISSTRADWQSDKELLEQSIALFSRELASVAEQMENLGTNGVQVDKERLQAEASLKSSNDGLNEAKRFAAGVEARIAQLVPLLPVPLQDSLKPLLNRLPSDADATKMTAAERIQAVVGILNEIDKFNNAINVFSEKRKNDKGEEVAVETVYVGLGAAYFINEPGDFAGIGTPGKNGWEWMNRPDIAGAVREVVRIYCNERTARFVALPVTIR